MKYYWETRIPKHIMSIRIHLGGYAYAMGIFLAALSGMDTAIGQQPEGQPPSGQHPIVQQPGGQLVATGNSAQTSVEQGQTPMTDTFQTLREARLEQRRNAFENTEFRFNIRAFYFDRKQADGSENEAFTIGGWAGLKTGYFFDHLSVGVTGYTSQKLSGDQDKDGTGNLKPGQIGYTVLGEAYADIRITKDLNIYVGRKEFNTPFINGDDTRMTPNTFEGAVLQGKVNFGENGGDLKFGAGYYDRIKQRNSDRFISMSDAAGATVNRGVYTGGALYEKGNFSIGAIDYYSQDIINIAYAEAKLAIPVSENLRPKLALQFVDQRSVGNDLLTGSGFEGQQIGVKAELPVKKALFTLGYTHTTDGTNMQSPWGGYPGFTSVQEQDFNRAGEDAFLVRAGYEFTKIDGLGVYALAVLGTSPHAAGQFRQNEYDANVEWKPTEGVLKGLSIRVRYALVQQDGGDVHDIKDLRVICNYAG